LIITLCRGLLNTAKAKINHSVRNCLKKKDKKKSTRVFLNWLLTKYILVLF
jgi:hypothetical protein